MPKIDPRFIMGRRQPTSAQDGLALLEELFRGTARTSLPLIQPGNQPSQARDGDGGYGLSFDTPRIETLLGNPGGRSGGRRSLLEDK